MGHKSPGDWVPRFQTGFWRFPRLRNRRKLNCKITDVAKDVCRVTEAGIGGGHGGIAGPGANTTIPHVKYKSTHHRHPSRLRHHFGFEHKEMLVHLPLCSFGAISSLTISCIGQSSFAVRFTFREPTRTLAPKYQFQIATPLIFQDRAVTPLT